MKKKIFIQIVLSSILLSGGYYFLIHNAEAFFSGIFFSFCVIPSSVISSTLLAFFDYYTNKEKPNKIAEYLIGFIILFILGVSTLLLLLYPDDFYQYILQQ